MLASRGLEVIAADPVAASLDVARRKQGAGSVRWLHAKAADLPSLRVDLTTMTGNVAQVFITDEEWAAALRAMRESLRPGGHLVFETRDPARKAWLEWTRDQTYRRVVIPDVGPVETWTDLTAVEENFVSFRMTFVFASDGATLTSDSTFRFRTRDELSNSLASANMLIDDIRDAPDRPTREFVFVARPVA